MGYKLNTISAIAGMADIVFNLYFGQSQDLDAS